jgi:DNA-binding transcriptional regulator YiaG
MSPKTIKQKDLFGNEEIQEINLVVKSGAWLGHFFNEAGRDLGKSLYNFATFSKKILDLDPYHEKLALRIALLQSTMDYRQYYTVEQWLIENLLGAKERINKAKKDKVTRQQLTKLWDKTLLALERIGYTVHFDERTYPENLRPTSPRKPRGYFERLLEAKVKLTPESLGKPESAREIEANTKTIEVKPPAKTYSGKELKKTRVDKKITQAMIAKYLQCSKGTISKAENSRQISREKFNEIMGAIKFVSKHPDKFK